MGQFVVGTLQSIRPFGHDERVTVRQLDIVVEPDIHLDVHDSSLGKVPLSVGEQYDLLLSPFAWKYPLEQSSDPDMWSGQIVQVNWEIPVDQFSHVVRRKRPDTDIMLIEVPFGRVAISYTSIRIVMHLPKEQYIVGAYLSWRKTAEFNLLGIV